tara:strand:+ start:30 stop:1145 length:1116 start_codon:yes stop_codon:yes gene_type:complete
VILAVSAILTAWPTVVRTHNLEFTFTVLVIRADGKYQIDVTTDLDALALGVGLGANSATLARNLATMPKASLDERLTDLRQTLTEQLVMRFDGEAAKMDLEFPEFGTMMNAEVPSYIGLTARFTGVIPERARTFTFQADRQFPPVYLTVLDLAGGRDAQQLLLRGEESGRHAVNSLNNDEAERTWSVASRYLQLGISHIVPDGFDHALFVFGLFLLSTRLRALLWQISAFTAAHTITLALAATGIITLSPAVVESLIALSIIYVAIENLITDRMTGWRPIIVFCFGLLHGLGFAGALSELALPGNQFLIGLLAFNTGVEIGQLTVLLAVFLLIGWTRQRKWYRTRVSLPCSLAIALVGLYWFLQRIVGLYP